MEESELAGWLGNHVETSFCVNTELLNEFGSSGFYCVIEGKRFKVRITECGEDI